MKVTIKEKTQKQEEIRLENLKPGTIINFGKNDPIGLVFVGKDGTNEVLLLNYGNGNDYFEIAIGWKVQPIREVFGKLIEIVVDPNV